MSGCSRTLSYRSFPFRTREEWRNRREAPLCSLWLPDCGTLNTLENTLRKRPLKRSRQTKSINDITQISIWYHNKTPQNWLKWWNRRENSRADKQSWHPQDSFSTHKFNLATNTVTIFINTVPNGQTLFGNDWTRWCQQACLRLRPQWLSKIWFSCLMKEFQNF